MNVYYDGFRIYVEVCACYIDYILFLLHTFVGKSF
jgi:hypothetical protein